MDHTADQPTNGNVGYFVMGAEQNPVDSHRAVRLAQKFHNKEYRDTYVESHTRRFLAHQMRAFRGEMSQTEFGPHIEKSQTIVSRLEDPTYSGWTLRTLFEIARSLNVAVIARFVDFAAFLKLTNDLESALRPSPYDAASVDQSALALAAQGQSFFILSNNAALSNNALAQTATANWFQNTAASLAGSTQNFAGYTIHDFGQAALTISDGVDPFGQNRFLRQQLTQEREEKRQLKAEVDLLKADKTKLQTALLINAAFNQDVFADRSRSATEFAFMPHSQERIPQHEVR